MQNHTNSKAWPNVGLIIATLALVAIGHPMPAQSADTSSSPAKSAAASAASATSTNRPIPVHILAGLNANKTIGGTNWIAGDKFFADGEILERPEITIATSTNTAPAAIYQAERYSMTNSHTPRFPTATTPSNSTSVRLLMALRARASEYSGMR